MIFSSLTFLCAFLPLTALLYLLSRNLQLIRIIPVKIPVVLQKRLISIFSDILDYAGYDILNASRHLRSRENLILVYFTIPVNLNHLCSFRDGSF